MELDDLLREQGLDAAGVEDALAWARRRAAELVRDVEGDPELGPLLAGAAVVPAAPAAVDRVPARAGNGPVVAKAQAREDEGRGAPAELRVKDVEHAPVETRVEDVERASTELRVEDVERAPAETRVDEAERAPAELPMDELRLDERERAPVEVRVEDVERVSEPEPRLDVASDDAKMTVEPDVGHDGARPAADADDARLAAALVDDDDDARADARAAADADDARLAAALVDDDDDARADATSAADPDAASERPDDDAAVEPMQPQPSRPQPLFADLRGLQAAFLAETDEEDDELPEVGAVLRAFQKGKGRSGSARSASQPQPTATGRTTPVDAGRARPTPTSTRAADSGEAHAARDPDAPVPRRRHVNDGRLEQPSASAVQAKPVQTTTAPHPAASGAASQPSPVQPEPPAEVAPPAMASDERPLHDDDDDIVLAALEPEPAPIHESSAAAHGVPAPPEADLDPLAGIDFDDLPGVDEDDEDDDHTHVDLPASGHMTAVPDQELELRSTMVPLDGPDLTLPSMQVPLGDLGSPRPLPDGVMPPGELTERAMNPLLPAEPTGEVTVTARAPSPLDAAEPEPPPASDTTVPTPGPTPAEAAPEPAEEIELLDDEDLLLVEEEPEAADDDEDVPEWKRALLENE